ncbi:YLP motif-containing protein 1 [Diachasma alloeum]|uniref:YLP motif-containing protein 1 n=1 Tax=Diachasma alloeum TaxID=454923 RepID=UPI0007381017|nr:YLP motif-containing protein 1 [Diachasma alloeum]
MADPSREYRDRFHYVKREILEGSPDNYENALNSYLDERREKHRRSHSQHDKEKREKLRHSHVEYDPRRVKHEDQRERSGSVRREWEEPEDLSRSSKNGSGFERHHREDTSSRTSSIDPRSSSVRSRSSSADPRSADEIKRKKSRKHHKHRSHHDHESPRASRWDECNGQVDEQVDVSRDSKRSRFYRNEKEVAASPWPKATPPPPPRIKPEPNNDIQIVECSNNKMRTQKRRMAKKSAPGPVEVVDLDESPPPPPPPPPTTAIYHPPEQSYEQPPGAFTSNIAPPQRWMSQISVVPQEILSIPPVRKFDTEYMVPEDNPQPAATPQPTFYQPPVESIPYNYRPQEQYQEQYQAQHQESYHAPQESVVEEQPIQEEFFEEFERKPLASIPSVHISQVGELKTQPPSKAKNPSYDVHAVCRSCGITFIHPCKYPPSTEPQAMFLEPGQLHKCKCSAIFLHTRTCKDTASKSFVPDKKETGLIKQVDRIHKYECHDCVFKFSVEQIRHTSHYFESITRKDGTLRERGKKSGRDLTPMLKHSDEIARRRLSHEPPTVQKAYMEMRRRLICQCNQSCCVVYHECPPKPADEQSDDTD